MTSNAISIFDTGVLGDEVRASAAVKAGGFVFVGGSIGNEFGKLELVKGGIAAETKQALANMEKALAAADCTLEQVLKCNIYLVDMDDFWEMNKVYADFFGSHVPTRATVVVKELGLGGRIEIECVALAG